MTQSADNDAATPLQLAPILANACESCGDCYHPFIGPNTDGDPSPWCRECGCYADEHTRMTYDIPPEVSAS